MDWTLLALPGIIPEGPLHPGLAIALIPAGASAALMAGRSTRAWTILVAVATLGLIAGVQGDWLTGGYLARSDRGLVGVALLGVLIVGTAARMRRSTATVVSICACAGVWAVVPDTEAPLIAGGIIAGAGALTLLPGWLADVRHHIHGLLPVLAVVAAAVGSIGRPPRFEPASVVGLLAALAGLAVWTVGGAVSHRQRAGTPTTVAPGATSSTTTAPAPTMAS